MQAASEGDFEKGNRLVDRFYKIYMRERPSCANRFFT